MFSLFDVPDKIHYWWCSEFHKDLWEPYSGIFDHNDGKMVFTAQKCKKCLLNHEISETLIPEDRLDTFEKSKLLAEVSERLVFFQNIPGIKLWSGEQLFPVPNLYEPENMNIAWEVLNWISRVPHGPLRVSIAAKFDIWWQESELYAYNPSQALQIALDKMLELAVKAGIVENRTANNSFTRLKSAETKPE